MITEPHSKPQAKPNLKASKAAAQPANTAFATLMQLSQQLELSLPELGKQLDISERTLHRRQQTKRLEPLEQMKTEMVNRVFERATSVLGNQSNAKIWIKSELPVLDNKSPLELLTTIEGYETVKTMLGRIASGTF